MTVTSPRPRRLAGIAFDTVVPKGDDVLPRMDIAVFAGFAASGPVELPVAVEDAAQFSAIFGEDAPLAWDAQRGATVYAQLGPAVRAFFANEGRRCWVIRLARDPVVDELPVPGVITVTTDGSIEPLILHARSPGSWADGLSVAASITSRRVRLSSVIAEDIIEVVAPNGLLLEVGDLLRLADPAGGTALYAGVQSTTIVGPQPLGADGVTLRLQLGQRASLEPHASPPDESGQPTIALAPAVPDEDWSVERLRLDLWARAADGAAIRVGDLGLAPGHRRHVQRLPNDGALYADDFADGDVWADIMTPRAPVAGGADQESVPERLCIPYTLGAVPSDYLPARFPDKAALVRDGLSDFDPALFGDEALADRLATTLLADAEYLRFLAPVPRPRLRGLHAALPIDEATLIAAPDAAQPGWAAQSMGLGPSPPVESVGTIADRCASGDFVDCGERLGPAPTKLEAVGRAFDGSVAIRWEAPPGVGPFELEEAESPDWRGASIVFTGPAPSVTLGSRPPGDYYYRVRAVGPSRTAWSAGASVRLLPGGGWIARDAASYQPDVLVAAHRLLLRLAAARRDLLAILSLPEHYREDETLRHVRALTSPAPSSIPLGRSYVPELGTGEADAFGFGAVYHGWIYERDAGVVRSIAPDGAVSGLIAQRANRRGAWVAPANEALRGVVALDRPAAPARWLDLLERQINVIRSTPRGFTLLSADTLAADDEVRPINVRRLLILLRRLATRLGTTYVFEPNDDAFRRMVQRGFEALLGDLFQRGAFSGSTAANAFQVVTGQSLNTATSLDDGRFIVELRVAPSRPLSFLTLRLVQIGERVAVSGA